MTKTDTALVTTLQKLLTQQGDALLSDASRLQSQLADLCPGEPGAEVIVKVVRFGMAQEMRVLAANGSTPDGATMVARLKNQHYVDPGWAQWALDVWARVLGVSLAFPSSPTASSSAPPPSGQTAGAGTTAPVKQSAALCGDGYRDNGDGTVTDVGTGLTWMRFVVGQTWRNGQIIGEPKELTWHEAMDSPGYFNRIGFAGHKDWRVPDIDELKTLILHHWDSPCCNHEAFPDGDGYFWSASPNAVYSDLASSAWSVDFGAGDVGPYSKSSNIRVRLVCAGKNNNYLMLNNDSFSPFSLGGLLLSAIMTLVFCVVLVIFS